MNNENVGTVMHLKINDDVECKASCTHKPDEDIDISITSLLIV